MLNRVIILASGSSVRMGAWNLPIEDCPVWNAIKNECVFSLNWGYKFCNPTIEIFGDYQFYIEEKKGLDNLPMIVSLNDGYYQRKGSIKTNENVLLLKPSSKYNGKDSWKLGFYSRQLIGIFALNFAIQCGFKEIFLLGFDCCAINGYTHFYEDDKTTGHYNSADHKDRCGVGFNRRGRYKTDNYNKPEVLNNYWFKPFEQEKNARIFNVSPVSILNTFPKINYNEFFWRLRINPFSINQDLMRKEIKELIIKNDEHS